MSQKIGNYFSGLSSRLLTYIFPFFLILLEFLIKKTAKTDTQDLLGPTLAAVGVGFILPLTLKKSAPEKYSIPDEILKAIKSHNNITIVHKRELQFVDICWLFVFISTALWALALYLFINQDPNAAQAGNNPGIPTYYWLAIINYFTGVILSELREYV